MTDWYRENRPRAGNGDLASGVSCPSPDTSNPVDGEHDTAANLYAVFDAEYTDKGAGGQPTLTTPRAEQAAAHPPSAGAATKDGDVPSRPVRTR